MSSTEIPNKVLRKRTSKVNNKIKNFIKLDKETAPSKKRKNRRRTLDNSKKSQHNKKIDPVTKRSLEYFWRQTEATYFPKKSSLYVDNINQVHQCLADPQEDETQTFTDYESYLSFEKLISTDYGSHIKDPNLRDANIENLIDVYRLSTVTVDQIDMNSVNIPNVQAEVEAWMRNAPSRNSESKTKKHTKYFLSEERTVLKRLQKMLGLKQKRKISPSSDLYEKSIDKELGQVEKEYEEVRRLNVNSFESVKRKCFLEVREERKRSNSSKDELITESPSYTEMKYLREVLASSEAIQMAESIKFVIAANRVGDQDFLHYCIVLDEAISREVIWVTFKQYELEHLETLRKAPIGSLTELSKSEILYSRPDKEIGWREIFEDKVNSTDSQKTRKKILKKITEYGMCHFCRKVDNNSNLRKCRYNSTTSGFPGCHSNNVDPLAIETHKHLPFTNEFCKRRNQFSFYKRKSHGLVCERKYCDTCLGSWFGTIPSETRGEWICPFCTGECYCSRCTRNANMIKLAEYYLRQGGNFDEIKRESMFEKCVFKYDYNLINHFYTNIEILIPTYKDSESEESSEVSSESENTKTYKKKRKLQRNVLKLKEKVLETVEEQKKCHYNLIIDIQTFQDEILEVQKSPETSFISSKRKIDFDHEDDPGEEKKIKTNFSSPARCSTTKSSISKDELQKVPIEQSYLDESLSKGSECLIIPINP